MADQERVDKWLFAVRVYKSRSQATEACSLGRVRVNGEVVKPAARIAVGDLVEARRRDRVLVYEVIEVIDKRVAPGRAAECVIDRSPKQPEPGLDPVAERTAGSGRPTKRDRRKIESFRTGRSGGD